MILRGDSGLRHKTKWKLFIILLVFFTVVVINLYENLSVKVTKYVFDTGKLQEEFGGLRIVQLSDIHMIRSEGQSDKIYNKTLEQKPDVIAITGDLIDTDKYANKEYQEMTLSFCRRLCSIAPVYFVYGNHEIMLLDDPKNNLFKKSLEANGVHILNNSCKMISKDGYQFNLLGVQDPATLYKDEKYAFGNGSVDILNDITNELDRENVSILLAHRPELFTIYTDDYNIDVTLTGHAHGGQFRIPFINMGLYAPNQGFFPQYTSGMYKSGGNIMVVNRGIGNSKIPFRFFNMPEIVVLDIR